jgi:hypothetical protein
MNRSSLASWARDVAPAVAVVVVASIAVSSQVSAADGMLPLLLAVGFAAIGAAALALHRADLAMVASPLRGPAVPPSRRFAGREPIAVDADPSTPGRTATPDQLPPPVPAPKPRKVMPPSMPTKWASSAVRALRFEPMAVTMPKLGNTDEENEDAYVYDVGTGRIVVADGASSSFASREWSRALCTEMVSDPTVLDTAAGVADAAARAAERWKATVSSGSEHVAWWAQRGLDRGAFAALLVIEVARVGKKEGWRALAIGDSCLIQLRPSDEGWRIIASFPAVLGEEFGSYPNLVQTSTPDEIEGL